MKQLGAEMHFPEMWGAGWEVSVGCGNAFPINAGVKSFSLVRICIFTQSGVDMHPHSTWGRNFQLGADMLPHSMWCEDVFPLNIG